MLSMKTFSHRKTGTTYEDTVWEDELVHIVTGHKPYRWGYAFVRLSRRASTQLTAQYY